MIHSRAVFSILNFENYAWRESASIIASSSCPPNKQKSRSMDPIRSDEFKIVDIKRNKEEKPWNTQRRPRPRS
jgi:hypothetical protein